MALRFVPLVLLLATTASAQEPLYMPPPSEVPPVEGPVIPVRVLADGSALVDGVAADSAGVVAAVLKHIRAHPDGGLEFSSSRDASYARYIHFLDAIKAAYVTARDAVALRDFGAPYEGLGDAEREAVAKRVPMRISLEEPE